MGVLDIFKFDENYEENEEKYKQIRKTILDEPSDDEDGSGSESSDTDEGDGKEDDVDEEEQPAAESQFPLSFLLLITSGRFL